MSTPSIGSSDNKGTVSRESRVIHINLADDVDTTRIKVNTTRETTLKSAIENFERDLVRFASQIEKARDALDAHYMEMIDDYAPVRKIEAPEEERTCASHFFGKVSPVYIFLPDSLAKDVNVPCGETGLHDAFATSTGYPAFVSLLDKACRWG